ncbi:MAG TPA: D-glycero-beta-D-manno-heptose 1-phosphate adenylyltransferase [Phycisphaerae bacterium]|nr:D-glycero-beta-D-manno-heptose 1-phosphate adenylyltransferase [Phycisphaerae bacterium]
MWQRLAEILERCAGRQCLLVGDFMIDRYLYGDAERISPEAPVPVLRVVRQEDALGGAGSVAADIAALDAVPHCVGIVGEDADGHLLAELLRKAGADPSSLVRVSDRPTTRKTRLIGLAQHRHRQQLIRVDDESTAPVDGAALEQMLSKLDGLLDTCQAVCIEDYNKGVVTPQFARAIIERTRRRGIPVLVDPAAITDYSRYQGATIITPNRTETEKVTGLKLRSIDAVEKAAVAILAACRTEHVCVTLDAEGAALIGPGGTFEHIPTKRRDVYDVTGAGDEVLAALAVAVAAGADWREAVAMANVAGGLEVEKFGCVPIGRDEILGEILLENHRTMGKVRALEQLLPELERRRRRRESVVFTNGCFDLLHRGHVSNLGFCKHQGDILVVGLNSDDSVRRQAKGPGRPIMNEQDRAAVLAALADVDYIVIFHEDTPQRLIEAILPDVLVKGSDWQGKTVVGQEAVEGRGGRVVLAPLVEGQSTSTIIERIRQGGRP